MSAAQAMRDLPLDARNAAIGASDNVHDLRPVLADRIQQRMLAKRYQKPRRPGGPA